MEGGGCRDTVDDGGFVDPGEEEEEGTFPIIKTMPSHSGPQPSSRIVEIARRHALMRFWEEEKA